MENKNWYSKMGFLKILMWHLVYYKIEVKISFSPLQWFWVVMLRVKTCGVGGKIIGLSKLCITGLQLESETNAVFCYSTRLVLKFRKCHWYLPMLLHKYSTQLLSSSPSSLSLSLSLSRSKEWCLVCSERENGCGRCGLLCFPYLVIFTRSS